MKTWTTLACIVALFAPAFPARAQDRDEDPASMSIEQLMQIEVTSVAKKKQSLARSAAAIYVITQEDIRRSGATSVPELLRMVPGLDVAQIDSSSWAISSRGFNSQYANAMLVLVDGRIVYSPSFSGVTWDSQDFVLEDIERIEVIRGPGATLWGSNAVNGVINIITKNAKATQGGLVTAETGNQARADGTVQYGGEISGKGYYRIFARYFDRAAFALPSGENSADGWHMSHAGFRSDWAISRRDSLTVQGDFFFGRENHTIPLVVSLQPILSGERNVPFDPAGGNLLGRWTHTFSARSDMTLQAYFDDSDRNQFIVSEHRHTTDVEFQDHLALGSRNDFVWGAGYRYERDRLPGSFSLSFSPELSSLSRYSSFAQDEILIVPDRLRFTVGARVEHDPYTGFNVQPDFRVLWSPSEHQAIWGAVSRPVRTPSRADIGARFVLSTIPNPGGPSIVLTSYGNPALTNADLTAYQVGYRAQIRSSVSFDVTAYHSRYSDIPSGEPETPFFEPDPTPPHLSVPVVNENALAGTTDGVELAPSWQVNSRWKLAGSYTWLRMDIQDRVTGNPANVAYVQSTNPSHQFRLHSSLNLPRNFEWDAMLYHVGALSGDLDPAYAVPAYTGLDSRIGWRLRERGEVSFVGQNLVHPHHLEFASSSVSSASFLKRSFYVKFSWHF
jgi:iron complex outermembrane recepter protein